MKINLFGIGAAIALCLPSANAASDTRQLSFQYGGIAGAWYLNARCKFLDADKRREFEWHVAQVTILLRKRGVSPVMLQRLRAAAKRRQTQPPYVTCNQAGRELVGQGFGWAKGLTQREAGLRYGPQALANFRLQRFTLYLLGVTAARQCGLLEDPRARKLLRRMSPVHNAVFRKLHELYGARRITQASDRGRHPKRKVPCRKAGQLFVGAVSLLRRLQADLEV